MDFHFDIGQLGGSMKKIYGYMRVSSERQNDERQRVELLAFGILPKNIYGDKLSGKDFNRPSYQRMKKKLKKNDLLIIKSLDRLGRNYREIGEEWRYITKNLGADIMILDMPLLNTNTNKDLINTLIADIVLMLLSYMAEQERDFIKQRQREGIAIAKANGVSFGRPKKSLPENFESIYALYLTGQYTQAQAAHLLNINENRFIYLHRCMKNKDIIHSTNIPKK